MDRAIADECSMDEGDEEEMRADAAQLEGKGGFGPDTTCIRDEGRVYGYLLSAAF